MDFFFSISYDQILKLIPTDFETQIMDNQKHYCWGTAELSVTFVMKQDLLASMIRLSPTLLLHLDL